jgi:hypothetical protein
MDRTSRVKPARLARMLLGLTLVGAVVVVIVVAVTC